MIVPKQMNIFIDRRFVMSSDKSSSIHVHISMYILNPAVLRDFVPVEEQIFFIKRVFLYSGVPVFLQQTLQRESCDQGGYWEFQCVRLS